MKRLSLLVGIVAAVFGFHFSRKRPDVKSITHKYFIETGWDEPTPARFLAGYKSFNDLPFDGTAVRVTASGQPSNINVQPFMEAFSSNPWEESWFDQSVFDLEQVASDPNRKLKENFLLLNANPGNVGWFDEQEWSQVVEHWRLAAKIAKEGGLVGIIFDPEPYSLPSEQFNESAQVDRADHSDSDYQKEARLRGSQVIKAVSSVFPDAVILMYYSYNGVSVNRTSQIVPNQTYQLLPAFLNGFLDVAPPEMTFVDGNEAAYRYNSESAFAQAAKKIRSQNVGFVPQADRQKYRNQFQVGFGLYLDAYLDPIGNPYYMDAMGGTKLGRLLSNVKSAVKNSDKWVWIYGEKGRWWPAFHGSPKDGWDTVFPGISATLESAK